MLTAATKAIQESKVQEMMKELSKYGLGIRYRMPKTKS
jgi:hypothetical protein